MPKRTDIKSILIPGSGPIVIGQASEFDYSGTQACRVLKKEGYRVILVNSNPATIMTDPSMADATYIEPLTPEVLIQIIEKEKPDAILPTVGGQTALNLVMSLHKQGYFEKNPVKLIGADVAAIDRAESRKLFKECMERIGMAMPESVLCHDYETALEFKEKHGLPLIIRPSFTLGGTGGGIAYTDEQFESLVKGGIYASPTGQILLDQSILGWKEYELEVMRDNKDNVVIVCSIENFDPVGVHTGDSITIAPQQTLSDVQYQKMRDASIAIIREIGVETGGSNIQFAVNPENGDMMVIEMNPRVSRSSALASKATGFPIAKIAALLAVGYTLDEITNDITKETPASFEPTLDYVVTKIPRFNFEKFPGSDNTLGTMMKSVGETMSIGRTFRESFQKAFRSLETDRFGWGADGYLNDLILFQEWKAEGKEYFQENLQKELSRPHPSRVYYLKKAMDEYLRGEGFGFSLDELYNITKIDPWFLNQLHLLVQQEAEISDRKDLSAEEIREAKQNGYSDRQLAYIRSRSRIDTMLADGSLSLPEKRKAVLELLSREEKEITGNRKAAGIRPVYKRVDTCAGEFEAYTPYLYSTYEDEDEAPPSANKKIMILGGGPNRIGQGIEFDYCCCHASFALQDINIESIMVNSNPETVSTDYDTSDRLYFEPLSAEDVLHICEKEKPDGVIVQFGGQTPLKLARSLSAAGVPIIGTSPDSIDLAEDRDRFSAMLTELGLNQPANGMARNITEAREIVNRLGYPVLVRPSYVLGGRAMAIVHNEDRLIRFMEEAESINPEHPVLIDKFLEDAMEIDVDALCDGTDVFVAGIMQHIEEAGIHSGDSAVILPPQDVSDDLLTQIREATTRIALRLKVCGLLNIQFAIQKNKLYIIEVNPRASRTVPFVSKSIGVPLANIATRIMCGEKLSSFGLDKTPAVSYVSVKEAVLPFSRFPGADTILGPEMKSTGEVMGIAPTVEEAYYKALLSAGDKLPLSGGVFFSVNNEVKPQLLDSIRTLSELGFTIYATLGTSNYLKENGIKAVTLNKMRDRESPNPIDVISRGEIQLIINIPQSERTRDDAFIIRQEAVRYKILYMTTVAGTRAVIDGISRMKSSTISLKSLQEIFS